MTVFDWLCVGALVVLAPIAILFMVNQLDR